MAADFTTDFDLIRALLRELYTTMETETDSLMENLTLSPPASLLGYENDQEKVLAHIELLVSCGLIKRTIKLRLRHHADMATLQPTAETRQWAKYAQDDVQWARAQSELELRLAKC